MRNIPFGFGGTINGDRKLKKLLAIATASLMIAAFTTDAASARHHHHHHGYRMSHGMMGAPGNNAELGGNNGNSASGDNSLGHIKGGYNGSGK